jgi:hypothetical protein
MIARASVLRPCFDGADQSRGYTPPSQSRRNVQFFYVDIKSREAIRGVILSAVEDSVNKTDYHSVGDCHNHCPIGICDSALVSPYDPRPSGYMPQRWLAGNNFISYLQGRGLQWR